MDKIIHSLVICFSFILCELSFADAQTVNSEDYSHKLGGIYYPKQQLSDTQTSPACPNNICPGLGQGFYLPSINARSVNTSGNPVFTNVSLGTNGCATISTANKTSKTLTSASSMEEFLQSSISESDLGGDMTTNILSLKGTVSAITSQSSDYTSTFNSTHMDIEKISGSLDFTLSSACISTSNLTTDFVNAFTALPLINTDALVVESSSWLPYTTFLQTYGSHILLQQILGSRFQQWESSTSTATNIQSELKIKACAEVEGTTETPAQSGWSVEGCSAYTDTEKTAALKISSNSTAIITGGTAGTRASMIQDLNKANLTAFLTAASSSDESIRETYKSLPKLLQLAYGFSCTLNGKGSSACNNLQRALTLQAAYEGWLGVGCTKPATGPVLQQMQLSKQSPLNGTYTYNCSALKSGCQSDSDCHLGGAGSVCYCYGNDCIDQGVQIPGTSASPQYRSAVRGSESGSYDEGVNNACYYHFIAHCDCNTGWGGGLLQRNIYEQGSN